MNPCRSWAAAAATTGLLLCSWAAPALASGWVAEPVMTGLVAPRGLAFAPDGAQYVTEAGNGGSGPTLLMSNGRPMSMGYSGGVSRLAGGVQTRVLVGLPSLAPQGGGESVGLQDIVFDPAGQAWGLFGLASTPAQRDSLGAYGASLFGTVSLLGLDGTGTVAPLADVARHEALFNPAGGAIDTNPYGLTRTAASEFIVADAGGNTFLRVASDGAVSTAGVLPARPNPLPFGPPVYQSVPTGVAVGPDGQIYIGELTGFPFPAGAALVHRHDLGTGSTTAALGGFTTVIDLDFDAAGNLYVLQISSNGLAASGGPGSGVLLRVDAQTGQRTTLLDTGLDFAGGLAIEDGPLGPVFYLSTHTNLPGGGTVLRVTAVPEPQSWALMLAGLSAFGYVVRRRTRRERHGAPVGSSVAGLAAGS